MLFRKKKTYTSEEAEKLEKEFANILLEDDVEAFIKFHKINYDWLGSSKKYSWLFKFSEYSVNLVMAMYKVTCNKLPTYKRFEALDYLYKNGFWIYWRC